ncbi:hypothetical protein [Neorhodopirellula pilleata]|nr:hypothetical protein [Neorhodopirellula pilleata]
MDVPAPPPLQPARYEVTANLIGSKTVRFSCPACKAGLTSPLKEAGTFDNCPECLAKFMTPGIVEQEQVEREANEQRYRQHEQREARRLAKENARAEMLAQRQAEEVAAKSADDAGDQVSTGGSWLQRRTQVTPQEERRRPGNGNGFTVPANRTYPNLNALCLVIRLLALLVASVAILIAAVMLYAAFQRDAMADSILLQALTTAMVGVLVAVALVSVSESIRVVIDTQDNTLVTARATIELLAIAEMSNETSVDAGRR